MPGEQPLLADLSITSGGVGQTLTPEALTPETLAVVIDTPIGQWSAAGLDAYQVALIAVWRTGRYNLL